MKTFEYFKRQYDKNRDYAIECIRKDIPVDSYHFVELAAKCSFGGTTDVDEWFNIRGVDDTQDMRLKGYVSAWDGGDRRRHVTLTKKGLRAFYKACF
jgi:hypothetical protein